MVALDLSQFVTIGVSGVAGLGGALLTIVTARIKAGPDAKRADTESFSALVIRLDDEIERMSKDRDRYAQLLKEAELRGSKMEVIILQLQAWIDEAVILFQQRGIPDFPAVPKMNGHAS